uniref:Uncharacterized protein n=1 Tax=Megaselia scalaris TaxID=36166 RepID=T1H2W7_MEGSC
MSRYLPRKKSPCDYSCFPRKDPRRALLAAILSTTRSIGLTFSNTSRKVGVDLRQPVIPTHAAHCCSLHAVSNLLHRTFLRGDCHQTKHA